MKTTSILSAVFFVGALAAPAEEALSKRQTRGAVTGCSVGIFAVGQEQAALERICKEFEGCGQTGTAIANQATWNGHCLDCPDTAGRTTTELGGCFFSLL